MKIGDKVQLTYIAKVNFDKHIIIGATATILQIEDRSKQDSQPLLTVTEPMLTTSLPPYKMDQSWLELAEDPIVFEL